MRPPVARGNAKAHLGLAHIAFIVSMPANFSIAQSNSLARACDLAGLDVRRTIAEPSAASLVLYQLDQKAVIDLVEAAGWSVVEVPGFELKQRTIKLIIIDLGGGTIDVSLVEEAVDDEENQYWFEVLAVAGDVRLGGIDYDDALFVPARNAFLSMMGPGARLSSVDVIQIRREAERAKIALGTRDDYALTLPNVETSMGVLVDLEWKITRDTFRELTRSLDVRVRTCILRALHLARVRTDQVGLVILAGQGSKVFTIREIIEDLFRGIPLIHHFQETAVVHGLANFTGQINGAFKGRLSTSKFRVFPSGVITPDQS